MSEIKTNYTPLDNVRAAFTLLQFFTGQTVTRTADLARVSLSIMLDTERLVSFQYARMHGGMLSKLELPPVDIGTIGASQKRADEVGAGVYYRAAESIIRDLWRSHRPVTAPQSEVAQLNAAAPQSKETFVPLILGVVGITAAALATYYVTDRICEVSERAAHDAAMFKARIDELNLRIVNGQPLPEPPAPLPAPDWVNDRAKAEGFPWAAAGVVAVAGAGAAAALALDRKVKIERRPNPVIRVVTTSVPSGRKKRASKKAAPKRTRKRANPPKRGRKVKPRRRPVARRVLAVRTLNRYTRGRKPLWMRGDPLDWTPAQWSEAATVSTSKEMKEYLRQADLERVPNPPRRKPRAARRASGRARRKKNPIAGGHSPATVRANIAAMVREGKPGPVAAAIALGAARADYRKRHHVGPFPRHLETPAERAGHRKATRTARAHKKPRKAKSRSKPRKKAKRARRS